MWFERCIFCIWARAERAHQWCIRIEGCCFRCQIGLRQLCTWHLGFYFFVCLVWVGQHPMLMSSQCRVKGAELDPFCPQLGDLSAACWCQLYKAVDRSLMQRISRCLVRGAELDPSCPQLGELFAACRYFYKAKKSSNRWAINSTRQWDSVGSGRSSFRNRV